MKLNDANARGHEHRQRKQVDNDNDLATRKFFTAVPIEQFMAPRWRLHVCTHPCMVLHRCPQDKERQTGMMTDCMSCV